MWSHCFDFTLVWCECLIYTSSCLQHSYRAWWDCVLFWPNSCWNELWLINARQFHIASSKPCAKCCNYWSPHLTTSLFQSPHGKYYTSTLSNNNLLLYTRAIVKACHEQNHSSKVQESKLPDISLHFHLFLLSFFFFLLFGGGGDSSSILWYGNLIISLIYCVPYVIKKNLFSVLVS